MKILFVCKSLPPAVIGGIQTHTWKLSEWLVNMGHQVSILTAGKWQKELRWGKYEGRNIIQLPYLPGRKLPLFPLLAEEWAFNHAVNHWLKRHEEAFDVIHIQGRSGFCFPGKQIKTPVVATFHGLVSIENEHSNRRHNAGPDIRLHERWTSFFEKNTLRHADACIAVSREMLREMQVLVPEVSRKTTILPNGVDVPADCSESHFPFTVSQNLLFVGRLDHIKGIFPLVEAMKQVQANVRLIMVGSGPDQARLERYISDAGLRDRITLTGALPTAQVFEKIRDCFALVLPSYHETQGIVLLEANACCKPVIASDIPGIREVVRQGETGWMSPVGDATLLASTINRVFEHPVEAARMGQAGKLHVQQNFAWEQIARDTERLYGLVLAQKNRGTQARQSSPRNDYAIA